MPAITFAPRMDRRGKERRRTFALARTIINILTTPNTTQPQRQHHHCSFPLLPLYLSSSPLHTKYYSKVEDIKACLSKQINCVLERALKLVKKKLQNVWKE